MPIGPREQRRLAAVLSSDVVGYGRLMGRDETGTLAACAEAVGMKFDQKSRKIMTFSEEDRARLGDLRLRLAA